MADSILDAILVKPMTTREVLWRCFRDDWNTRRDVLGASSGSTFHVRLTLSFEVGIADAREALREFVETEGR